MDWLSWGNDEDKTEIEKYFDNLWFHQKASVIQSAYSGELLEDYPDIPFTAKEVIDYAKKDDYNLWSAYGETFGTLEKNIDDTAEAVAEKVSTGITAVTDTVSTGITIAKYIPIVLVGALVYKWVYKK